MVVRFLRLNIEAESQEVLIPIKNWLENKISKKHLHNKIGDGTVRVFKDELSSYNWFLNLDMYIIADVKLSNYISLLKTKIQNYDKSSILNIKIIKNANCTHDEAFSQSDVVEEVYNYGM